MANEVKKKAEEKRSGVGLSPATISLLRKKVGERMAKTGKKETNDSVIRAALEALK